MMKKICCYCPFEKKLVKPLPCVTYSPTHRQAGTPVINTQSTLRTAPDLRKSVSFAVLFGSNGNTYTISTQSDV